jgi:hypothetical protein
MISCAGGDAGVVPATPLAAGLITPTAMGSTLMSSPRGADDLSLPGTGMFQGGQG